MLGLDKITDAIKAAFDAVSNVPAPSLPAVLLWCTAIKRPGISINKTVANIIATNEQCGIPTGKNPDGSDNLYNQLCYNITKGIMTTLQEDAVVNLAIGPGSIMVTAEGGNAGGPVVAIGYNTNTCKGSGIIQ